MRILFDQGVPAPLRRQLQGHAVETAAQRGWSTLTNGALLHAAEVDGFDLFITTDQNLRYQQQLTGRRLAIVVLMSTSWPRIQGQITNVVEAVHSAHVGTYTEVQL